MSLQQSGCLVRSILRPKWFSLLRLLDRFVASLPTSVLSLTSSISSSFHPGIGHLSADPICPFDCQRRQHRLGFGSGHRHALLSRTKYQCQAHGKVCLSILAVDRVHHLLLGRRGEQLGTEESHSKQHHRRSGVDRQRRFGARCSGSIHSSSSISENRSDAVEVNRFDAQFRSLRRQRSGRLSGDVSLVFSPINPAFNKHQKQMKRKKSVKQQVIYVFFGNGYESDFCVC